MAETVQVVIDLPKWKWFALGALAERRGVTVARLLVEGAERVERPVGHPRGNSSTGARVKHLHGQGLTDPQMALALHCAQSTVRYHRDRLGLPINPARR